MKACTVGVDGYIKDKKALSPAIPVIIPTVKVTRDALATDEEIAAMLADT